MNFDEALALVAKKNLDKDKSVCAVAYTPRNIDGEFHIFTLECDDGEDEDMKILPDESWFSVSLNAGNVSSPSCGVEGNYGGETIEDLKRELSENDVLSMLNRLKYKVVNHSPSSFFMSTTAHCLKLFFGDEIGDNNFMSREDEKLFVSEAIKLTEKMNKN